MYILLPVIFLFILILIFPLTINIKINTKIKDSKIELEPLPDFENSVKVKLIKFIPVFKTKLFTNKKKNKRKKKKTSGFKIAKVAIKTLNFDELYLYLGVNTYSYILNSYVNALINTTICMYINLNENKFNFKKLYYQIYTSEKPFVLNLEANLSTSIIKFMIEFIKLKKNDQKSKAKNYYNHSKKMNKSNISCTY